MGKMIRQTSFTAGEVSENTWKRTDIAEYLTAAQSLLNTEVGTTGLARKRKGTTFRINATGKAVFSSTMYEFVDRNGIYYLILGGNKFFYVFSVPISEIPVINFEDILVVDYLGNQVVYGNTFIDFIQAIPVDYEASDLFDLNPLMTSIR